MLRHDSQNLYNLYRFNDDLKQVEYWSQSQGFWMRSDLYTITTNIPSRNRQLKYEDTWCEPFGGINVTP